MISKITKIFLTVFVIGFMFVLIGCQTSEDVDKNIIKEGALDIILDPSRELDMQFETCANIKDYIDLNDNTNILF